MRGGGEGVSGEQSRVTSAAGSSMKGREPQVCLPPWSSGLQTELLSN